MDQAKPNLGKTTTEDSIIHALRRGRALCGFSLLPPSDWPDGHVWSRHSHQITCARCQKLVVELIVNGR